MYKMTNKHNGSYCELLARMTYQKPLDLINLPYYRLKLSIVTMSYEDRTVTCSFTLHQTNAPNPADYELTNISVAINGIKLYSVAQMQWNSGNNTLQVASGSVTLPYDSEGKLDKLNLSWDATYEGTTYTYNSAYLGTDSYPTADGGFIRDLQKEPFFTKSFWNETWTTDSDTLPTSYFMNDTVDTEYRLVVPYVPAGATALRMKFHGGFWSLDIANPTVTRYVGRMFLDAEQRKSLYTKVANIGGGSVYSDDVFSVGFVTNGTYTAESQAAPFNIHIVPNKPIVEGSVVDTNAAAIALTGDSSKLIRYVSNAQASMSVIPLAGAVIEETGIQNGAATMLNVETYNFEKVSSNVFNFYALDSRGYTGTDTITTGFVDYVIPSAVVKGSVVTGEGDMNLKVSGNYYKGSFGKVENEIFVYYRYKLKNADDSEYTDWIQLSNLTIDEENKTYSVTTSVSGLDYTETYVFQAHIADALFTIYSADYIAVSTPIFDWSATDFNFNVPVTVMGKPVGGGGENTILWNGSDVMNAGSTIELAEPISAQTSGIALIFSAASGSNTNVSWNVFFVPKIMVQLNQGGGQTFLMGNNAGLATFGAKYLYIYDESIVGHFSNQESGDAASGISVTNQDFVLRYVIGV